ncbi:MAG: KdsC family phosphatase [Phycisphaerae bacterium]
MDFISIKLIVLDVDGVLTDGGIRTEENGELLKQFSVQDGCAIKAWQRSGGEIAILSGRASAALDARLRELGIKHKRTGSREKLEDLQSLFTDIGVTAAETCYVGDDLPDLAPIRTCAIGVAVANAVPTVKQAAQLVTRRMGGSGAIAELIEFLLRKQGKWSECLAHFDPALA